MKEWKRLFTTKSAEEIVDMVMDLKRRERAYRYELRCARAWFLLLATDASKVSLMDKDIESEDFVWMIARIDKVLKPRRRK